MGATNWRLAPAACAVVFTCGCASPEAPPPSTTLAAVRNPDDTTRLEDRAWGVVRSPELGVKLALPEARSWLPLSGRPTPGAWELRHEPTGSTLSVRRWRASRLPRVDACETELRERFPGVLAADETNLVARRDVRIPEGFVTRITLLAVPGKTTRISGQVLAVGAGVGECLAVVARTDCASEAELAERLRLLDAAASHLRLMHIEDRIPTREKLAD